MQRGHRISDTSSSGWVGLRLKLETSGSQMPASIPFTVSHESLITRRNAQLPANRPLLLAVRLLVLAWVDQTFPPVTTAWRCYHVTCGAPLQGTSSRARSQPPHSFHPPRIEDLHSAPSSLASTVRRGRNILLKSLYLFVTPFSEYPLSAPPPPLPPSIFRSTMASFPQPPAAPFSPLSRLRRSILSFAQIVPPSLLGRLLCAA